MKYLGIDFGAKRVGVAISDEGGKVAFPKLVLLNDNQLILRIKELCHSESVSKIVVGESRNFAGKPNPIMSSINVLVEKLKTEVGLEVILEPEFMTSEQARRLQGENDKLDASAAALILQSYLDKNNFIPNS